MAGETVQTRFEAKKAKHGAAEEAALLEEAKRQAAADAAREAAEAAKAADRSVEESASADADFDDSLTEGAVVSLKVDETTRIVAIKTDGVVHLVLPTEASEVPVTPTSTRGGAGDLWGTRLGQRGQPLLERGRRDVQQAAGWLDRLMYRLFGVPAGTPPQPPSRPAPPPVQPVVVQPPPQPQQQPSTSIVTVLLWLAVLAGGLFLASQAVPIVIGWFHGGSIIGSAIKEPLWVVAVRDSGADAKVLQKFASVNDDPTRDEKLKALQAEWRLRDKEFNRADLDKEGLSATYQRIGTPDVLMVVGRTSGTVHWAGPFPDTLDGVLSEVKKLRRVE